MQRWRKKIILVATVFAITGASSGATGSANYSYDGIGRLVTALYDNGMCVVYSYDQNGNRTSQINSTAVSAATWGTGVWGCFVWTP